MVKEETEMMLNDGGTGKCRILGDKKKKVAYFQVILV
jgi:hypothetical protein